MTIKPKKIPKFQTSILTNIELMETVQKDTNAVFIKYGLTNIDALVVLEALKTNALLDMIDFTILKTLEGQDGNQKPN